MRRGLIKDNCFTFHDTFYVVTCLAAHSLMGPSEREGSAPLMIEERRLPSGGIVAIGARRNPIDLRELGAMNVLMTLFTFSGRRLEVRINQLGLHIGWLVAVNARRSSMRPQQRE